MSRPREHWGEVCPFCGRHLTDLLHDRLIDGPEFELECPGCEKNWHVEVHMIPEFALLDATEYHKHEKRQIDRVLGRGGR